MIRFVTFSRPGILASACALVSSLLVGSLAAQTVDLGALGINWDFETPQLQKTGDVEVWASQPTQLGFPTFGSGWSAPTAGGDFGLQNPASNYFGGQNPLPAPFNGQQMGFVNLGASESANVVSTPVGGLVAGSTLTLSVGVSTRFLNDAQLVQYDVGLQTVGGTPLGTFAQTTVSGAEDTIRDLVYTLNVNSEASAFVGEDVQIVIRSTDLSGGSQSGFDNVRLSGNLANPNILTLVVNQQTGAVSLNKAGPTPFEIRGYSLTSAAGSFDQSQWTTISDTYDDSGDGSVDPNDNWTKLTAAGVSTDLSEFNFDTDPGDPGVLSAANSPLSLGTPWRSSPFRDVVATVRTGDGSELALNVIYEGDNIAVGDFNGDGSVNALDWPTLRDNYRSDHTGIPAAVAYGLGDLNGDLVTDLNDLLQFKSIFNAENGAGAFEAMVAGVPEPASLLLVFVAGAMLIGARHSRKLRHLAPVVALLAASGWSSPLWAQTGIGVNFRGGQADNDLNARGPDVTGPAGVTFVQSNWNNVGGNFPATDHVGTATGLLNSAGANSGASISWSTAETWSATGVGTVGSADQDRNLVDGYIDAVGAQPTATANLADIPFAAYDVYVYVGSDGDDRTGRVRINDNVATDRWFRTSTSNAAFTSAANYIAADARTEATSVAGNYVVYQDIVGDDLLVGVTRGSNNVGLHAIQIVEETNPQILRLNVNRTSGLVQIHNPTAEAVNFDYFEIASANSALDSAGWSPLGTGTNDGSNWEVLGNNDDSFLAQFFLDGQGTIGPGQSISLGSAYDGAAQDLVFRYNDTDEFTRTGLVQYSAGALPGDFNNNGSVENADLTLLLNNWGKAIPPVPPGWTGDQPIGPAIDNGELTSLLNNWGNSVGSSATVAGSVPEPATGLLLLLGMAMFALRRSRDHGRIGRVALTFVLFIALNILVSSPAQAVITYDRLYLTGDPGSADATLAPPVVDSAANVAEGNGVGFVFGGLTQTGDQVGPSGAYIDAIVFGSPTYTSAANRPGAGAGQFGIRFDGVDDFLGTAISLNAPSQMWNNTTFFPGNLHAVNYSGIFSRGIAAWARPDVPALSDPNVGRQDLIIDTQDHGIFITDGGNWGLLFDKQSIDTGISVASTLDTNGWAHVMQLAGFDSPVAGDSAFGGALLVNGVAMAARDVFYDPSSQAFSIGANQDGTGNFYKGVLDNPGLFLWGDNSDVAPGPQGQTGKDFGTLNLATDNDWIAQRLAQLNVTNPGDVNLDGQLTSADVTAFVGHWLSERRVDGVLIGDWVSRQNGDLNFDGIADLGDAVILHDALLSAGLAGLNFSLLGGTVPEPSTALYLLFALAAGSLRRRRTR